MKKKTWIEYYEATRNTPPPELLIESMKYVGENKKVLDLGAGSMRDSLYLLEKGYDVVAVDSSIGSVKMAELVDDRNFQYIQSTFEDLEIPNQKFDLISAQWSLPFIAKKEDLHDFMEFIKEHLNKDGIFSGQFFGTNDEWNIPGKPMVFLLKDEVSEILDGYKIIKNNQYERDSKTARGVLKHWHVFEVITQKID